MKPRERLFLIGMITVDMLMVFAMAWRLTESPVSGLMATEPSNIQTASIALPVFARGPEMALFPVIAEKSLFQPGRQALPPPRPAIVQYVPPPPPSPSATYALVGTVGSTDNRIALVRAVSGTETLQVKAGQQLGGWNVIEVLTDRLVVEAAERRDTLALQQPKSSSEVSLSQPASQPRPISAPGNFSPSSPRPPMPGMFENR